MGDVGDMSDESMKSSSKKLKILTLHKSKADVIGVDSPDDDINNYTDDTDYTTIKDEEETICKNEMKSFEECMRLLNGFYTLKDIEDDIYVLVAKAFETSPFSKKSFLMTVPECQLAWLKSNFGMWYCVQVNFFFLTIFLKN
jgi:hypothetical protein